MAEKETHIRFSRLKIQLRSAMDAEVKGDGDLFVNRHYVHFLADDYKPGYSQCGFVPWDMISYISYDEV